MSADFDEAIDIDHMVELFRAHLQLCRVKPLENVAILTEGDQFAKRALAYERAARSLGALPTRVVYRPSGGATDPATRLSNVGQSGLGADRTAMQALKSAHLVIDMMLLLFSREQLEIQAAGARIVLVVEPFETLARLFPTEALRRRVEAGERRLARARSLRFTNALGSDLTYDIAGQPILTEYGYSDIPGRWDHWPGGFLATTARAHGVEGNVVLGPGDHVYPLMWQLQKPVEIEIRNGLIVSIHGGDEAKRLLEYIERYDDPRAYAISHIGWGLNERCVWDIDLPGIGMDGRAYYGNVLFSTGPDSEFGGSNDTACHLDIPMRDCTLTLDRYPIVVNGQIIPADMRA